MIISKQQYREEKKHPEKLRSCHNCNHLREVVNLWCSNEDAIKARGTQVPGIIHCPYWSADKTAQQKIDKNITQEIERGIYYTGIQLI